MAKARCGVCDIGGRSGRSNISIIEQRSPKMERAMSTKELQNRFSIPAISHAKQIGKGLVLASAIAALSLTAMPSTAHAGNGVGAAIGLGILGGVIAGAAIASSVPPVYGAPPPPAYDYPPQPQPYQGYYAPAPTYYDASQPYYGWTPYR